MDTDRRQFAPATARNRGFILPILQRILPAAGTVLEVGSGTGEHAVHFARHLPALRWQPTDADPAAIESIASWVAHAALPNLNPPLLFDLTVEDWPLARAEAVVAIAPDQRHPIAEKVEERFHGVGAVFTGLCDKAEKARKPAGGQA